MQSKKILVTGGTGYIGSHTVVDLLSANHEVVIVDNLFNSKASVVDAIAQIAGKRPKFHRVDLTDHPTLEQIFEQYDFDAVIHFAGLKAVAESIAKPIEYYENNLVSTLNLLKSMRDHSVHRIIFSSSACVYGDQGEGAYDESFPTGNGITNPYGRTKYKIEEILKDVAVSTPELEAVILRYFNPVGNHSSGLLGEDPNGIPNNLMPIIMKVATGEMQQLSIYGDDYPTPDGTAVRDFVHVTDLASGHLSALDHARPGVAIYNLGTGKGVSVMEMVTAFESARGDKLPYSIAPRRDGDLPTYFADVTKASQELGWQAQLTIEDAMRDTIAYLKNTGKLS